MSENFVQPKKQGLLASLGQQLKEWSETTSFHGFPNIARSKTVFITTLWVICLCGSSGYCTYSVYKSVITYFQFNVITHIRNVYEAQAPFPTITMCNFNPFVTNQAYEYARKVIVDNKIYDVTNSSLLTTFLPNNFQAELNSYMSRSLVASNAKNEPDSVKKTFGMPLNGSLPMCFYNMVACNYQTFNWFYSSDFGNCYQFNAPYNMNQQPNEIINTIKAGPKYGLGVLIFTGFTKSIDSLSFGTGAHIFIHNSTAAPNSISGVDISPGSYTNIAVTRSFSNQLPEPYNNCYEDLTTPDKFDSFYYRETLKSGYAYRQVDCFKLVEQDSHIKNCMCADANMPTLNETRFCLTLWETFCLYDNAKRIYQQKLNSGWDKYCPLECQSQRYVFSTSTAEFPSDSMASIMLNDTNLLKGLDYLNQPKTIGSIRSAYTYVNIYFDYTGYTLVTEAPAQELVDLLSSVGGTMGLYLGISFLSFVEAVELVILLLLKCFSFNRKHNIVNVVPLNMKVN